MSMKRNIISYCFVVFKVTQYLTSEFYCLNYSLRQRLDILEVTFPHIYVFVIVAQDEITNVVFTGPRLSSSGAFQTSCQWQKSTCELCAVHWNKSLPRWQPCSLETSRGKTNPKQNKIHLKGTERNFSVFKLNPNLILFLSCCCRGLPVPHPTAPPAVSPPLLDTSFSLCWEIMTSRYFICAENVIAVFLCSIDKIKR